MERVRCLASPCTGRHRRQYLIGAYLRYNNAITYVAAVADTRSGEIRVTRVCASHDCGEMVNPDGVANQVEAACCRRVSRTLLERVTWDRDMVKSVDWKSCRRLPRSGLLCSAPDVSPIALDIWRIDAAPRRRV
jgi:CO/xanthine dehydrogenase Mo-binding subunit